MRSNSEEFMREARKVWEVVRRLDRNPAIIHIATALQAAADKARAEERQKIAKAIMVEKETEK